MKKMILSLITIFPVILGAMEPLEKMELKKREIPSLKTLVQTAIRNPKTAHAILQDPKKRLELNQLPSDIFSIAIERKKYEEQLNAQIKKIAANQIPNTGSMFPEASMMLDDNRLALVLRNLSNNKLEFVHITSTHKKKLASLNDFQNRSHVSFLPSEDTQAYPLAAVTVDGKTHTTGGYNAQMITHSPLPNYWYDIIANVPAEHYCIAIHKDLKKAIISKNGENKKIWYPESRRSIALENSQYNSYITFSDDGSIAYDQSDSMGICYVWNTMTGEKLFSIKAHGLAFDKKLSTMICIEQNRKNTENLSITRYNCDILTKLLTLPNSVKLAWTTGLLENFPELAQSLNIKKNGADEEDSQTGCCIS